MACNYKIRMKIIRKKYIMQLIIIRKKKKYKFFFNNEYNFFIPQGRQAHNLMVAGSNPTPRNQ